MLGNTPTKGRILIEEYYKVLYLNNEDFEKYNFSYWQNYFGVEKSTLRNIFNYIFFPLPDEKNPSEVRKILYFKDFEFEKRRKMIADMSTSEYNEYLENTQERPELEEASRLEYLVYQSTATEPRISERTVPIIDEEIDSKLDSPLIHSDIIKQVDERIEALVKTELQGGYINMVEKDVELSLSDIKRKRLEAKMNETKRIDEERKSLPSKEEIINAIKENEDVKLSKRKEETEVEVVEDVEKIEKVEKVEERKNNF